MIAELAEIGFESFAEESSFLLAYIPEKDFLKEKLESVSAIKKRLAGSNYRVNLIEDQNWNALWESNYQPVDIAGRCFIRAPFHEPKPDSEFNILLKPKMAFGTAHHETTALMIGLLLDADVIGKKVLDMGSGTAVLAILAAMKGATEVSAIDNDEWAYNNAAENISLNDQERIEVLIGDARLLTEFPTIDLMLANINKNVLLSDIATYSKVLKQDGYLYLSGFYESDLEDISHEAKQNGLMFVSRQVKNDWTAAIYKKQ